MCEPKLGIFWYDEGNQKLFAVNSLPENKISPDYNGKRVYPILHVEIWNELYNKYHDQYNNFVPDDVYQDEDSCPYKEIDYTKIPRGRIFSTEDGYQVCVGDWFYKIGNPEIVFNIILKEFNLELYEDEVELIIDEHWNIGNGWGE